MFNKKKIGKQDKNGVNIRCGDIIKGNNGIFEVYYFENGCYFCADDHKITGQPGSVAYLDLTNYEVVGNKDNINEFFSTPNYQDYFRK